MNWEKNEALTVEILGYTAEGDGVAKVDGRVIFVPNTIKGEIWEIILVKIKKNYAHGKAMTCITASPERLHQDCAFSEKCGGCQLRHMTYPEELRLKHEIVENSLQRIGGVSLEIPPVLACENQEKYRNKVQYQVGGSDKWVKIGFFRARSHDVLDVEQCLLQQDFSTIARNVLKTWMEGFHVNPYDEKTRKGTIRHLFLRCNEKEEILLCLVTTRQKIPYLEVLTQRLQENLPNLKGFLLNVNKEEGNVVMTGQKHLVWGKGDLDMGLCELSFQVGVESFFQVNLPQTEKLYGIVRDFAQLSSEKTVLDLYCGTGSIGLSLASGAKSVVGQEISQEAFENAKENAKRNGIENASFVLADCAALPEEGESKTQYDVVIVDPPRKGLVAPQQVLDFVKDKLIYVSCDPGTLARDLKFFTEQGMTVEKVQPVDMFPRTKHVETVVLLTK